MGAGSYLKEKTKNSLFHLRNIKLLKWLQNQLLFFMDDQYSLVYTLYNSVKKCDLGVIISIQRDTMRWQHSFCHYSKITRKVHTQEFNESWISMRKVLTNILLVDRNLVQLDFDWAAASKTGTQSTVFITLHQWYH